VESVRLAASIVTRSVVFNASRQSSRPAERQLARFFVGQNLSRHQPLPPIAAENSELSMAIGLALMLSKNILRVAVLALSIRLALLAIRAGRRQSATQNIDSDNAAWRIAR
jgi:hypothetical protein